MMGKQTGFLLFIRFLYTEELSTKSEEFEIEVAFEVMKCAGKYGVPYLYTQCRQWIVSYFIGSHEPDCKEREIKERALPNLQMVKLILPYA